MTLIKWYDGRWYAARAKRKTIKKGDADIK